jgi:TolB-like protein/Flp pilus assembly protein TadD
VVELAHEPLGLPPWTMRVLVIAAITGFPISFFLAWVIDWRSDGLIFDLPLWVGEEDDPRPEKKSDLVYAALLAVLLAGGIYLVIALFLETVEPENEAIDASDRAPLNSIAVLAFDSFDVEDATGHFASGLAEEILNLLAAVPEMSVAARTSSFRFREEKFDIRDVARLLAVRNVLEGSVRRDRDRVRVTAQLINGEEGYHLWSKTYDRKLDDIFAIQQEIASAVVNELKIALSVDSQQQLGRRPTENVNAYIYFLQGQDRLRSSIDADVMTTATQLFERAIEIDPGFARAYAGICEAQLELYEITRSPAEFEAAEKACETAGELDPELGVETQLALGNLYRYRGWIERAEEKFQEVVTLAPENVDVYIALGELRTSEKRNEDAEAYFRRAIDLQRNYWRAHHELARFLYRTERYAEAIEVYELVTALAPDVASVFAGQGAVFWMLGDMDGARRAYDRSLELKPSRLAYTNMGLRYYYEGQYLSAVEMQRGALEYAPDDHRVLGRLAESYRFIEGADELARENYEKAASAALKNLELNQNDWKTLALLGLYTAHLDRRSEATRHVNEAIEMSGGDPEALYYQALVRQRFDDIDGAFESLEAAVAADDQYRQFIASDPDLKSLSNEQRYQALLPAGS